jgi:ABC-2 type transport system ATP-binding protein
VVEGALDVLGRQALAGGRYRIEVETDGANPQLVEVIGKVKGVKNVEADGNFLHITTDSDLRAAISKVVVDSGAALIQMKVQEFSLDDIYKKYFKEG